MKQKEFNLRTHTPHRHRSQIRTPLHRRPRHQTCRRHPSLGRPHHPLFHLLRRHQRRSRRPRRHLGHRLHHRPKTNHLHLRHRWLLEVEMIRVHQLALASTRILGIGWANWGPERR